MIGPAARGAWAALRTPLWLRGERFRRLLSAPAAGGGGDPAAADGEIRAAARALRLLARLPFSPWRSTCLYRSVAACVLLRARSVPARIRLGVGEGEDGAGPRAHAWVSHEGPEPTSDEPLPELVELLPAAGGPGPRPGPGTPSA